MLAYEFGSINVRTWDVISSGGNLEWPCSFLINYWPPIQVRAEMPHSDWTQLSWTEWQISSPVHCPHTRLLSCAHHAGSANIQYFTSKLVSYPSWKLKVNLSLFVHASLAFGSSCSVLIKKEPVFFICR